MHPHTAYARTLHTRYCYPPRYVDHRKANSMLSLLFYEVLEKQISVKLQLNIHFYGLNLKGNNTYNHIHV